MSFQRANWEILASVRGISAPTLYTHTHAHTHTQSDYSHMLPLALARLDWRLRRGCVCVCACVCVCVCVCVWCCWESEPALFFSGSHLPYCMPFPFLLLHFPLRFPALISVLTLSSLSFQLNLSLCFGSEYLHVPVMFFCFFITARPLFTLSATIAMPHWVKHCMYQYSRNWMNGWMKGWMEWQQLLLYDPQKTCRCPHEDIHRNV